MLGGNLAWRAYTAAPPAPVTLIVQAPTAAPSATPTPTAAPTPAQVSGMMTDDVFLHQGPAEDTARLGAVVRRKERVEILAVAGNWYRVRWVSAGAEVIGWTPAEWVGRASRFQPE